MNTLYDLSRCRVLLVDDSLEFLGVLQRMLTAEGYPVVTAASRAEALAHFERETFHVAVVDVRLVEDDPLNREGLLLMRELRAIDPCVGVIILTVHADVQIVREALQPLPEKSVFEIPRVLASEFLDKSPESLKQLPDTVSRVFQEVARINWGLHIDDQQGLLPSIANNLSLNAASGDDVRDELEVLLRKLFADWERISVQPIAPGDAGKSKAHVLRVLPFKEGADGATVIAKLGEHALIEREVSRFRTHVDRKIPGSRYPSALTPVLRTRKLGGMIYTFLGMDRHIADLRQVFQRVSRQDIIERVIDNLFNDTLSLQHRRTQWLARDADMRAIYADLLRLKVDELVAKQEELLTLVKAIYRGADAKKFWLRDGTGLLNPVEFAFNTPIMCDYYEATIHGDLHGQNILVDHHWDTWLIDFANTGKGPVLQDFVALETWLLITNIQVNEWTPLFTWGKALYASRDEMFPALPDTLALNDSIRKAHDAILTVRRIAFEGRIGEPEKAQRAYLIGMLFTTLRMMTVKFLPPLKRFHALTTAALIANLLADVPAGARKTGLLV